MSECSDLPNLSFMIISMSTSRIFFSYRSVRRDFRGRDKLRKKQGRLSWKGSGRKQKGRPGSKERRESEEKQRKVAGMLLLSS